MADSCNSGKRNAQCEKQCEKLATSVKVARYSFLGSIPPKFKDKPHRHKQRFGIIATSLVLDKDENLL